MGDACSTHVRHEKCMQNFSRITKREKNLSINGKYKILMGIKEMAYRCMNRICDVENTVQWLYFLSAVINLRVQ
jgi:hypothetical protein